MQTHDTVAESSRIRPLRRTEYERLVELGAFENEKIELMHGEIVYMSPQGYEHYYAVGQLNNLLAPALHRRALVLMQAPIAAGPTSEPEPDISVLPLDAMDEGIANRAHLIIEVAHSSLHIDRTEKLPLYASAGFPEVWLVDVNARALFVHRQPAGDAWAEVFRVVEGGTVSMLAFPDVTIEVAQLFPPRKK